MNPNILLIVLDSVRAKNTSLHGYERNTTPFIDSFSENAVNYTQARSPGMTSLPSHTSIFTGLSVEEHKTHDSILHKIKSGQTIWDELRQEYNYSTGVFSYNVNLVDRSSTLRDSFDYIEDGGHGLFPDSSNLEDFRSKYDYDSASITEYIQYIQWALSQKSTSKAIINGALPVISKLINSAKLEQLLDRSADRYIDSFLDWSTEKTGPWAACINLMDAHHPYHPRSEYDMWGGNTLQRKQSSLSPHPWEVHGGKINWNEWAALEDLYDGTIRQLDSSIEYLIEQLQDRGKFDNTFIVITSDHGEGFGESSRVRPDLRTAGHVAGLHECLLHVPLVVSYPDKKLNKTIGQVSTLSQFPSAVRKVIDGSANGEEFVPDNPVVASGSNIDKKLKNTDRAGKYCDDIDRFSGIVRAVYEQTDDGILKHISWGDNSTTIKIDSVDKCHTMEEYQSEKKVSEAFSSFQDAGILQTRDSVDDSTRQRLENLGYV